VAVARWVLLGLVFVALVLHPWICGAIFQPQQDRKATMQDELELIQVGL
jgi:hypothetical protein